jgi:hypothetical protein
VKIEEGFGVVFGSIENCDWTVKNEEGTIGNLEEELKK